MRDATLPIVLTVPGVTWLLNSLDWLPEIHWIWILGLAGAGIAILALDGLTKSSIVAGPLLIPAGVLMLVARSASIPESRVLNPHFERKSQDMDRHG